MARERGRGQILELRDGSFHIRWFAGVVEGSRKYAGKNVTGSRADAEAELARILAQLAAERAADGEVTPRLRGERLALNELVERWLVSLEASGTSERTRAGYKAELRHVLGRFGRQPAAKLTRVQVERLLNEMTRAGAAVRTRRGVLGRLRSAFKYAMAEGLVHRDPCEHVKLPPESQAEAQAMTADELRTLLEVAEADPWAPWWILLAYTGLRPGEAAALEWNAVEWEARALVVRQALTRDAAGRPTIAATKTKRIRVVPFPERVLARLREHQRRTGTIAGLIFRNREGGPVDLIKMARRFKTLAKKAGLRAELRMYSLRHSAASLMLDAGQPVPRVASVLGHRPSMLMARYAHRLDDGREASEALERALNK